MGLSELEQHAVQLVSRTEIVDLARWLISTRSVSGDISPVAESLGARLQSWGLNAKKSGPGPEWQNVTAHMAGAKPDVSLLLSGHLDTVPAGEDTWTVPPFDAMVIDGDLYGRGAADMKGGVAAIVCAAAAVLRLGIALDTGFMLAFTCDEEIGSIRGMKYLCDHGLATGKMGIAAEPTSLEVQGWFKGRARYEIKVTGKAAHSSNPERGINAIVRLAELITRIDKDDRFSKRPHPILGKTTLNFGTVSGGVDGNTVPDLARAILEVRTVPGQTSQSVLKELCSVIEEAKRDDLQLVADAELVFAKEAMEVEKTALIVEEIRRVTADLLGVPAAYGHEPVAGGDMYYASHVCGTAGVDFGPGDLGLAHTIDEHVSVGRLVHAAQAYAVLILRLCGTSAVSKKR